MKISIDNVFKIIIRESFVQISILCIHVNLVVVEVKLIDRQLEANNFSEQDRQSFSNSLFKTVAQAATPVSDVSS